MAGMISEAYAATRREAIDLERAMAYPDHGNPPGRRRPNDGSRRGSMAPPEDRPLLPERAYGGCTTSFSIADQFGNVVVCTPTLGSGWGTGVIVGETGLLLQQRHSHWLNLSRIQTT